MESELLSSRNAIRKLFKHEIGDSDDFFEFFGRNFDMYQIIHTKTLSSAVKFAYLCHMLRPTMLKAEYQSALEKLSYELQSILTSSSSESCLSSVITSLELSLKESHLKAMLSPEALVRRYTIEGKIITMEQFPASNADSVPIIHVLSLRDKQAILYTPAMTFIDGFDPYTGEAKVSIMPALLVKKTRDSLFSFSKRKHKKKAINGKSSQDASSEMDEENKIHRSSNGKYTEETETITKHPDTPREEGKHQEIVDGTFKEKLPKANEFKSNITTSTQKQKFKTRLSNSPELSDDREGFDEKLDRIFADDSFDRPPSKKEMRRKNHHDPRGCCTNECILF